MLYVCCLTIRTTCGIYNLSKLQTMLARKKLLPVCPRDIFSSVPVSFSYLQLSHYARDEQRLFFQSG